MSALFGPVEIRRVEQPRGHSAELNTRRLNVA